MPIRVRRIINWLSYGVLTVVLLLAVSIVGGLLWLRSSWGGDFVRGQIESQLEGLMWGEVQVGRVSGDIISGIVLEDFAMVGEDGVALIDADKIVVDYALAPFFERRITLSRVRLENPDIHIVRYSDGRWNFKTLFKPRPPRPPFAPPGWGTYVDINRLEFVDGNVQVSLAETDWPLLDWDQNEFRGLNGKLDLKIVTEARGDPERRFVLHDLAFRTTVPELDVQRLNGKLEWTDSGLVVDEVDFETRGSTIVTNGELSFGEQDSFALDIDAPLVGLDEWRRFFPAIRLSGNAEFKGRLAGPIANPVIAIEASRVDTGRSIVTASGELVDLADLKLDLDVGLESLVPDDIRLFWLDYPFVQPLSGNVRVTGPPRRLNVDANLRTPVGGLTVDGTIGPGPPLSYNVSATSSDLDIGALIGRPEVDVTLSGGYVIEGVGTGAENLEANLVAELTESSIYWWDLAAAETQGRLLGRVYQADSLSAEMLNSVVRGTGTFGLASDGVIQTDVEITSGRLAELWPDLAAVDGSVVTRADISGTYGGFDVAGDVEAGQLAVGGAEADSFTGRVTLADVRGDLSMTADGALKNVRVLGLAVDDADVDIRYNQRIMNIDGALLYLDESRTDFSGVADFRPTGTAFRLERIAHTSPTGDWAMSDGGSLTILDGTARFEDFQVAQEAQRVRLGGEFAITDGESDLAFEIEQLEMIELARLAGRPTGDWEGRLTMSGRLTGPRADPKIELEGGVSAGRILSFRFVGMAAAFDYFNQTARIDLTITTPTEGHDLVVTGDFPINLALVGGVDRLPNRAVDLAVRSRNTDLSLLAAVVPGLSELSGPVQIEVNVGGTAEEPRFEGFATLENGRFRVSATGVKYRDLTGTVSFNNDRVRIERITGRDNYTGTFEASGEIAMENLQFGAVGIDVALRELAVVDLRRQLVRVGGSIALEGTTRNPLITGQVKVEEAIYRLPERSRKQVIDLDEATLYVEVSALDEGLGERSPSTWTRARVDLLVQVADNAILTASNARAEIVGDLSLFKASGADVPTFSGTLNVRRGFYREFGQRFTIQEGEVFFFGTPELNPGLHIVAQRTVQNVEGFGDVDIRIIVGGRLRSPTIDLESTPEFDKSEIIAIALFGSPSASTASQQGQLDTALRTVFVGASAQLQSALASEVGLDILEISQREEAGGQTATLFRIGKFITPDVYVTVEQEVGGEEDRQAVGIRYQVSRAFALQATTGTRQSAVDLFWEFSY